MNSMGKISLAIIIFGFVQMICVYIFVSMPDIRNYAIILFIFVSMIFAFIVLRPVIKGYLTTPKYLIIPREGIKTFTGEIIKFEDIKNVEIVDKSLFRVGIGSFFIEPRVTFPGYHVGTYHISGLGKVKMISTTWVGMLVIITTDKIKYAISPKDPEQFVDEIKTQLDRRN